MNSSSTSSITPAKSHKKREIKIPQVDSVQVLLRPLMTSLPKELNALNMHYQKTLDQVFYEEFEKAKEKQDELKGRVSKAFEEEPESSDELMQTTTVIDINKDDFSIKEEKNYPSLDINDEIFKECFPQNMHHCGMNLEEEESYNYENDIYSLKSDLNIEQIIEHSNQIIQQIKRISMKMQMNKIRTVDLFKTKNKTYTILDKQKKSLICKIVEGFGAKKTATSLNLSIKSLKRWMKNGIDRKKGGGRKIMDPNMEIKLLEWYNKQVAQGKLVTAKNIKDKAKELSVCKTFLASKGWFEKYKVKYHIKPAKHVKKNKKNS